MAQDRKSGTFDSRPDPKKQTRIPPDLLSVLLLLSLSPVFYILLPILYGSKGTLSFCMKMLMRLFMRMKAKAHYPFA